MKELLGGSVWIELFAQFLALSCAAIGGAIVLVPDMHRLMVVEYGLLTDAQFAASIAIAQAAPGPNLLFIGVLGFQAAGLGGAAATLVGIMLPSTTLTLFAARWGRHRENAIGLRAFKAGMVPITIALMVSTGWVLLGPAPGWPAMLLAAAAALLAWRTRVHLLWLIGAGGLAGALGLV